MYRELYKKISEAIEQNIAATVATVVNIDRSAPTLLGSKMLVYPNGDIFGTIGGGEIEHRVIQDIVAGQHKTTSLRQFNLVPETGHKEALSMVCGGVMHVLIEPLLSSNHLVIIGAGHCSIALAHLAKMVDFRVTVVDNRQEWANKSRHLDADNIICMPFEEIGEKIPTDSSTYIVIMTNGHKYDECVLRQFIPKEHKYLGVIGSKPKVLDVFNRMQKDGFTTEQLQKVFSPIGFALGTKAPNEVAVSIMAQILAVKNSKSKITFSSNPLLSE